MEAINRLEKRRRFAVVALWIFVGAAVLMAFSDASLLSFAQKVARGIRVPTQLVKNC